MANSTVSSPIRPGASLRKTNKPLMEKRRRARINDSLTQLKSLVITGTKKDSSQFNKLEKADILELTVKHLRNLQTHQQQQQQQQQQRLVGSETVMAPRYQDGFVECANEVIRYLGQAQGFSDDTKCRVINHLASCIQLANNKAKTVAAQPPVNMNICQNNNASAAVLGGGLAATSAVSAQGQIIQIVNGPPPAATGKSQNVHILPSPSTAALSNSTINIAVPINKTTSCTSSLSAQQIQTPHYAQPLSIQIPPAFSPVLIGKADKGSTSMIQKLQQHHQPMDIAPRPVKVETSPARSIPAVAFLASKSLKQPKESTILPVTPGSTPRPQQSKLSPLTIPTSTANKQQRDTPITHVHKIHGFYSSADDFIPSRPRTFSMASSSSSSSTENELSSPLNLSQSPTSYSFESRRLSNNRSGESAPKPRHFMDKNGNNNNFSCNNMGPINDQENVMHSFGSTDKNMYSSEGCSPPHVLYSVMVNNCNTSPETPSLKFMSMMMEEVRTCTRNHGHRSRSTSPASSVGEDRLWRPW
ncbi:transcription factor hes-1 [Plakobranchus ocellatus]|uniref:Transcription factor hes-1 n=1 Tax=Plakobranchus ocellatus TaxID=259542 RepID=A0AAV3ZDH5_9GAST|nr:transcription factor hes-1 [Plakobranchus ocellatus]